MDIIAIATLGVATVAAYLASKSPTKKDLERVESHIAKVDSHLSEQNEREAIDKLAQRVHISVKALDRTSEPLNLQLTIEDPSVTLIRVELIGDLEMLSGTADCVRVDQSTFTATVLPQIAQHWLSICSVYLRTNQKKGYIRAVMHIDGRESHKTLSVLMLEYNRQLPNEAQPGMVLSLSGQC
jgi:hypothetical protein